MVRCPPTPFESDKEVEVKPKGPTIASLNIKIINLRKDIRILRVSLAKSRVKIRDLEEDINTLRLGIGTKINRLARVVGVVDFLDERI